MQENSDTAKQNSDSDSDLDIPLTLLKRQRVSSVCMEKADTNDEEYRDISSLDDSDPDETFHSSQTDKSQDSNEPEVTLPAIKVRKRRKRMSKDERSSNVSKKGCKRGKANDAKLNLGKERQLK